MVHVAIGLLPITHKTSLNCVCVSTGESCCLTSYCAFDCPQHLCHYSAWLNPEDATEH